jgi:hypothetical protein
MAMYVLSADESCGRGEGWGGSVTMYSYDLSVGLYHELNNYKTPNPKCRLCWCSIELKDWRYCSVGHVGIFDWLCELLPL